MPNPNLKVTKNNQLTDTGTGNNQYVTKSENGVTRYTNTATGDSHYATNTNKGNVFNPTNQSETRDVFEGKDTGADTGNTGNTSNTGNTALDDAEFATWYANFLKGNQFNDEPYKKLLNAQKINQDNAINSSYRKGMKGIGDMANRLKTSALSSMVSLASNRASGLAGNENTYNQGLNDLEEKRQTYNDNYRNTILNMDYDTLKKLYKNL